MVKIAALPLLGLIGLLGLNLNTTKEEYRDALHVTAKEGGTYRLDSIDATGLGNEMRIYCYDDMVIDEIADNAFAGTSFTSVAISNCVTNINTNAFAGQNTIKKCYFTGSEEEFDALYPNYLFESIYYYAIDEGFINYWNKEVRPSEDSNICDITRDEYEYIRDLYTSLIPSDKEVVDAYEDAAGATIKDSIKELNRHFGEPSGSKETEEWNQTGAITLIIIIAVIGMTSITIFFLLKTKQIID